VFKYHLQKTEEPGEQELLEHEEDLEHVAPLLEEEEERAQVHDADKVHVAHLNRLALAEEGHGEEERDTCRGAWARVTIDQFRHLALQTC
jgi:hypothetical protein